MPEEKQLSENDAKRLEELNETIERYEKEGYRRSFLTAAAPGKVHLMAAIYGLILSVPFVIIYFLINRGTDFADQWNLLDHLAIFILCFLALIVIHELIHGLFFGMFSRNGFKDIRFGINVKALAPYCNCKEPLKKTHYMIGCFMPCLLLGIIPCIVSLFTHSLFLLEMGVLMILGAGGDLMILQMILSRKAGKDSLYLDHPTEVGCVLLEK